MGSGDTTTFQSGPHDVPDLDGLELPTIDASADEKAEFELSGELGRGGMGRVVSARQRALQRSVALKFLKDDRGDPTGLLREAIVTGRLEHPNLVPVHVLARTPQGQPFFSMKRVEGTPWSEVLRGPRALTLVQHLEVLRKVCDAVAFAHSRDVIHRDLKPSNVLLGAFGEVYVVDWGLAAALRPDTVLPLATESGPGGTPAYLAPEAAHEATRLGPWTDVFLLGATLYEVLAGRPPWGGASVHETMVLATECVEPPLDRAVPAELAQICRRAMKKDPAERFATVREFQQALVDWLEHREALEVHERSMRTLGHLEAMLRAQSEESSLHGLNAQALFNECRFGFEQVRRTFPAFVPAREGLLRATTAMVRSELERGEARAARMLLSQLEDAPAGLAAEVEAAERAEAEQSKRLTRLEQRERETSTESARDPKAAYSRVVAVVTVLGSVVAQALVSSGRYEFTTGVGLVFAAALLLNSLGYAVFLARQKDVNELQRRISHGLAGLNAASAALWWLAVSADLPFHHALVAYFVLNAAGWWTAAIVIEQRGVLVAVGFAVAAVVGAVFPQWVNGAGVVVGVSFWLLARRLRSPT
ncbi:MAG: serine/threonine-protein kinase [Myxococcaceae bacterium]